MDTYMSSATGLYTTFLGNKKKERFEIILEPLQALLQLALLAYCPIGTKLAIANNLLVVQHPYWGQALVRTYYQDSKDDLFYLFNVIARYNKFYSYMKDEDSEERFLFKYLVTLAKKGIDNLLHTYTQIDRHALLHTLQMYKTMLESPDLFDRSDSDDDTDQEISLETNIDDIFINIRKLYSKEEFIIIYNTLLLVERNPQSYEAYMTGLNNILEPTNQKIKKWINDNIVF